MASAAPSMDVEEEFKCPICMECLTDPVVLDCGHSFCQGCITNYYEKWEELGDLECPICKCRTQRGNFRRNWQLAHIVEKRKLLSPKPGKEDLCKKHKEKFLLFCKEDEELVCVLCERSPEHKGHTIVLLEEAAQQYKDKISRHLETLKNEREKILAYLAEVENESQEMLKIIESERQKTVAEFRILQEEKNRLLAQLEEMEKEIARKRDEYLAKLSEELSTLESLIREMEEKHQQPVKELLQDVRSTLQRYEEKQKFGDLVAFPAELKWKVCRVYCVNHFLEVYMKQFKDSLASGLQAQKVNVTLDPDTANPHLILSEDRKSVKWEKENQKLPRNSERFDFRPFVMGCEEFTAGQHFWEVIVGGEKGWAVGVAKKSVRRTGWILLTPEEGIWAVGGRVNGYYAWEEPDYCPLSLSEAPERILISLDYEGGRVTFLDADRGTVLCEFSGASFSGEILRPIFYVEFKAHLRLSP